MVNQQPVKPEQTDIIREYFRGQGTDLADAIYQLPSDDPRFGKQRYDLSK